MPLVNADELIGGDGATRARFTELIRESEAIPFVADATAAAALVSAISAWFTPSTTAPLFAYFGDAATWQAVKFTEDGSTWYTVGEGTDSGWTAPASYGSGFSTYTNLQSRLVGNRVSLRRFIRHTSAFGVGVSGTACTLAVGHRPPETIYLTTDGWVSGGTPAHRGGSGISITSGGVVTVSCTEAITAVYADGLTFLVD